jgi:hypothetical protein
MKRDKLDAVFSDLVRERANWTCERCGKYFPEGSRMGIHCSHIYSRRHAATRTHPLNAVAHCYACHSWYGGNPVLGGRWAESYLGTGIIQILEDLLRKPAKITKAEKEEKYQHYKKELQRLKKLRAQGKVGRIEFEGYE